VRRRTGIDQQHTKEKSKMGSKKHWNVATAWILTVFVLAVSPAWAQKFSGFLENYEQLKPDPEKKGVYVYLSDKMNKRLRSYRNMMIDPVEIQLSKDAEGVSLRPDDLKAIAGYCRNAFVKAVYDVYVIEDEPGPLTLRLRMALTNVKPGDRIDPEALKRALEKVQGDIKALSREIDLGEATLEAELVDSETGERIAAVVEEVMMEKEIPPLTVMKFSRYEEFAIVRAIFDNWAAQFRSSIDRERGVGPVREQ
jgi:hypothetical protein